MNNFVSENGSPYPLGSSAIPGGAMNFALFSQDASSVRLSLFSAESHTLLQEITLDPIFNKTGNIWHILIKNPPPIFLYAYHADGPHSTTLKQMFDPPLLLLDPYAKHLSTKHIWGSNSNLDNPGQADYRPLGILSPLAPFDWQDVRSPSIPLHDLIIYEMHVRGFTRHPSSQAAHPGTFLGVIEKIPYLIDLGVNALEFLPIHEFNENEVKLINPATHQRLCNYWGYSTVNFFSPMNRYASQSEPGSAMREFKTMVRELHRHGIEVILDVVYNHTAEGNEAGPVLSFKGIDNSVYYLQDPDDTYSNFSGCGNTFSCNHPVGWELILASLRYWVLEGHVDGFRFDLASILTRGKKGLPSTTLRLSKRFRTILF